jgi:Zn-dependent M28 family amino/carboxypeptidase
MAFAGEEAGLYGSKHYVDHPLFPLKNIQFLFNLDIMGSGEDGVTIVNGSVFQEKFDLLSSINSTQQFVSQVKIRGKAANSDHYFFSEAGVPAFFMYTMGPNKHYHDVGDTYENLSFNEFNDIFQLLVDFEEEVTKKVKK